MRHFSKLTKNDQYKIGKKVLKSNQLEPLPPSTTPALLVEGVGGRRWKESALGGNGEGQTLNK